MNLTRKDLNDKAFLNKKIKEILNRYDSLSDVKTAYSFFFVSFIVIMILILPSVCISKTNIILKILDCISLPFGSVVGFVGLHKLNSLIKYEKSVLDLKVKERKAEIEVINFLKEKLPEQYKVYSNIFTGYGDVDGVVIGPSGVYAIEVKSNSGIISQNDLGYLTVVAGDKARKNYRKQVIGNTNRIKRILDSGTGRRSFVYPVLVFPYAEVIKGIILSSNKDKYKVPVLDKDGLIEYIISNLAYGSISKSLIEDYCKVLDDFVNASA